MNQNAWDLLYLAACAVNGTAPNEDKLCQPDPEELFCAAAEQSLEAICCMALESGGLLPPGSDLGKKWHDAKNKVIRKTILLDSERQAICAHMQEAGIWFMPLKGSLLKDLYPRFGMRQMSDNDILIDPEARQDLHDFMLARGYQVGKQDSTIHDEYRKPPTNNFELHYALANVEYPPKMVAYYRNVKDRLVQKDGMEYRFTDEDFYLFMMAHAFRHYEGGGSGLRNLLDVYVYLQKKGSGLDFAYIEGEAQKLGIADFERVCRELSVKLMSDPEKLHSCELSREEAKMLETMVLSGTYGNQEMEIRNRLGDGVSEDGTVSRSARMRYYLRRLFPDLSWYERFHPFLYRWRILIPFFAVWRLVWAVFTRRGNIRSEMDALNHVSQGK